jgi:phosphomannomutase/phosphoglucomutase
MSGHFFLNDRWPGFDDSLYNTARLLEMIGRDPSPNSGGPKFSERFSALSDYPSTDETKVPLTGEREATMSAVEGAFSDLPKSTVDGIRVTYPNGWYLCRPSNTEPILVMRAEGRDEDSLDAILSDVQNRIGHMLDLSDLR